MSNSEFAEPYTIIEPFGGPFKGDVTVPGDKSISHRAVLFAAMAEGTSHLSGVLDSEDVDCKVAVLLPVLFHLLPLVDSYFFS